MAAALVVTGATSAYADANPADHSPIFPRITQNVDLDVTQDLGTDKVLAKLVSVTTPIVGDFAGTQNLIATAGTRAGQIRGEEEGDTGHIDELSTARA